MFNQALVILLLLNLGLIMYHFGPQGFFITVLLAAGVFLFLNRYDYIKKTWPYKAAALVVMAGGIIATHDLFNLLPLTLAISCIMIIAFFIFGNISKF